MSLGKEREHKDEQKAEQLIGEITAMAKDRLEVLLGSEAGRSFKDLGIEPALQEKIDGVLKQARESSEWLTVVNRRGYGATYWSEDGVVVMRMRKQEATILEV